MARYYSASSGSFWSPDPGGIKTADPTNPIRWNRYLYASGDPINRIDPLGREDCDPDEDDPCFETEVDATADDGGGDDDGGGGDGDGVDSSPQQPQKPSKPNKPQKPCANTSAVNFISAHLADASTLGASLNVPVALVLAVSEAESTFGNSPVAQNAQNFFGFHAGGSHSTGTYTTSGGAQVSSYLGVQDPYLASGLDFVGSEKRCRGNHEPDSVFHNTS